VAETSAWSLKRSESRSLPSPPDVTALACKQLPNSTMATKRLLLVPYQGFVYGSGRAPKKARDLHWDGVKPIGMLGGG